MKNFKVFVKVPINLKEWVVVFSFCGESQIEFKTEPGDGEPEIVLEIGLGSEGDPPDDIGSGQEEFGRHDQSPVGLV